MDTGSGALSRPAHPVRWITAAALLAVGVLVATQVLPALQHGGPTDLAGSRPNVVLVVFDDLDTVLADEMPNLVRLRARALNFTDAFVTSPLCCPSRASILTGLYPHNHGVLWNQGSLGGAKRFHDIGAEADTLPIWLQHAGYQTAMVGRYLNRYGIDTHADYVPPGWDEWQAVTGRLTYRHYRFNVGGQLSRPDAPLTPELARRSVALLGSLRAPFFLNVNLLTPHLPIDIQGTISSSRAGPLRRRLALDGDRALGAIADALPPNTFLIVTSDNGFHLYPTPSKYQPYDSDTHVPLFIVGPPVATDDRLALNIDIAPTIATWAGIHVRGRVDGRPLTEPWQRDAFLIELQTFEAVHTRDSLYVEWKTGYSELRGPASEASMKSLLASLRTCARGACP